MGRFLRILLAAALVAAAPAWADAPAVAVLDLDNATGDPALDAAGPGIAAVLAGKLSRTTALQVVERQRIRDVLGEIALGSSGAVDPATAAQAGRILGADYLVAGALFSMKLPAMTVSLRVIDAETGKIVASREIEVAVGDEGEKLFVLLDEVAWEVIDALGVRLGAEDRIALGQVDVKELETVEVYGAALAALDAGDTRRAERELAKAVSMEPGFRLAEDALRQLSRAVGEKRAAFAHEDLSRARAFWDALAARAKVEAPTATEADVAKLAVLARLALVRGDFETYFATEEKRARLSEEIYADPSRLRPYPDGEPHRDHPSRHVGALVYADGDAPAGEKAFADLVYRPWEIRYQAARVMLLLGRRQDAVDALIDAYRHPGPLEYGPGFGDGPAILLPRHPLLVFREWGLASETLVLAEKEVRLWQLSGDAEQEKGYVRLLDEELVPAVRRENEERRRIAEALAAPGADLDAELALVEAYGRNPDLLVAGYRAFVTGVAEGRYATAGPRFAELARAWRAAADAAWGAPWAVERRLEHLANLQEQLHLPEVDRRPELQRFVEAELSPRKTR